jgi:hypothetical protein
VDGGVVGVDADGGAAERVVGGGVPVRKAWSGSTAASGGTAGSSGTAASGGTSPASSPPARVRGRLREMCCRGRWLEPGKKMGYLYPRIFSPGWCYQPGLKVYPLVPVGATKRD